MTQEDLRAAFDEEAAGARVAGLAAGVCVGGRAVFSAAHDVDRTTSFRVASVTKTFTAVAVLQLVEQGLVGLDDRINDQLRSLRVQPPRGTPPVTVRHLLTHRAGLREPLRWSDLLRPARFVGPRVGKRVPSFEDLYGDVVTAQHPAGDAWSYSNDGYAILGRLVEDLCGTSYADYVTEHIWRPLGMIDSTFSPAPEARVAEGHRFRRGKVHAVPARAVIKAAAGGVWSSLSDMLRWAAALADPARNGVLNPSTLQRVYEPQVSLADRVPYTGLGMFLNRIGSRCVAFHPGDFPGYEAALFVAPEDATGAVVLCNSTARGAALRLARRLLTCALGVLPDDPVALDPSVAGEVAGNYAAEPGWRQNLRVAAMTGGRLTVSVDDGALSLRSRFGVLRRAMSLEPVSGSDPLHFRGQLRGAPYDGVPIDVVFGRAADGRVQRLDLGILGARFHRH